MRSLNTRQLTGVLYSMGRTFDNLSSTYMATREFLRTNNPAVIGSRQISPCCRIYATQRHGPCTMIMRTASMWTTCVASTRS